MRRTTLEAARLIALCVPVAWSANACGPKISDTGYTGTWSRGNDRVRSTIAIVERDGRYLFRWGKESSDGRLKITCDWNGECIELSDGQEVARYQFRAWWDEPSGRLRVECRGRTYRPEPAEIHYVDEAIVRDGTKLVVRTIEKSGQQLSDRERSKFVFHKVSDAVVDPPARGG